MHNFINVELEKILKLREKNVCSTHIDGEHVQAFKYSEITMDKYALHSNFHARDMD